MSPSESEPSSSPRPFTKAERIQQLNDVDKSITQLLKSAGLAIKTLTAAQSNADDPPPTDRRQAFEAASNSYLNTLQGVDVRLKRQIWGLEEADIISPEKAKVKGKADGQDPLARARAGGAPVGEANTTDGGMGKLDIGWLNSRSGRVGKDMEAELWAKAKNFLENVEKDKSQGNSLPEVSPKDHEMDG